MDMSGTGKLTLRRLRIKEKHPCLGQRHFFMVRDNETKTKLWFTEGVQQRITGT